MTEPSNGIISLAFWLLQPKGKGNNSRGPRTASAMPGSNMYKVLSKSVGDFGAALRMSLISFEFFRRSNRSVTCGGLGGRVRFERR